MGKKHIVDREHLILIRRHLCALFLAILLTAVLLALAPAFVHAQGPEIAVSPTSAVPESSLTITGTGFVPGFTATITIDGKEWGSTVVSKNGTFSLTLPVPPLSPGVKTVTANDSEVSASTRFNVLAEPIPVTTEIGITPPSGLPGSIVTVEGAGFKPRSQLTITMDGIEVANVGVAPDGTFSTTAHVPELPPGVKPVIADPGRAITEFNVLASLSRPPRLGIPDLAIMAAEHWFEKDGRVLIFSVEIMNQGEADAPETLVLISDENRRLDTASSPLRGLLIGATTVIEIGLGIPEDQFGTIRAFVIQVDPESQIADPNRDNNRRIMEISLPVPEPGVEPPRRELPWPWIVGILAIAAGAGVFFKKWLDRTKGKLPREVEVRAHSDLRNHQIESDTPIRLDYEIRLRPVMDLGKQSMETEGTLVIGEQKEET
ncbi:CARDB domain-containing protein [Chloroflexota bacterium]